MVIAKEFVCPRCSNPVSAQALKCSKCGAGFKTEYQTPQKPVKPLVIADPAEQSDTAQSNINFGISSLLLITTLIAVCMALTVAAPGLGILLTIISVPALVRTIMVVQKLKSKGQQVSTEATVGLYIGSVWVTFVITCVTIFTAVATFCLTCIGALSSTQGRSESTVMTISISLTVVVAGLVLWSFSKWIRSRWRRDTGQK